MRKRIALTALLTAALALLCACAPATNAAQTEAIDLRLLATSDYRDDAPAAETVGTDGGYVRVDLWLDATQNMGGVNPNAKSMYPHAGRKYREGGFHYRCGGQVGWYESLLGDVLTAADGMRVRTLRYGSERFTDDQLQALALPADASVRRDLCTLSADTRLPLFATLSAEDMAASLYALGSPMLDGIEAIADDALENPPLADAMRSALRLQISSIADGSLEYVGTDDDDCAFLRALACVDPSRLTVMTVDPSSLRALGGTNADGSPADFVADALRERGIFERGMSVGLLTFRLDYLGQMGSVGAADLSEPLIWGRAILNEKKQTLDYAGVMPRQLLMLVLGAPSQVDGFLTRLDAAIAADASLRGLRGPANGELTYTADGATVTQQPFTFEYHSLTISRPSMGYYTQHTASLTVEGANADGGAGVTGDSTADGSSASSDGVAKVDGAGIAGDASPDGNASANGAANTDGAGIAGTSSPDGASASSDGAANADGTGIAGDSTADGNASANGVSNADGASVAGDSSPEGNASANGVSNADGAGIAGDSSSDGNASANADGATVAAVTVSADGGVPCVTLACDASGKQPDRVLTLRFPVTVPDGGASLDVSRVTETSVEALETLVLAESLDNSPSSAAELAESDQAIAYRDRLYVFRADDGELPFTFTSIAREGDELVCRVQADGSALKRGFYRLMLCADASGEQLTWETPDWIDELNATVTDADVYAWETFAAAIAEYDRDASGIPRQFQHAWGSATDKPYHGLTVPNCPPVYKAIGLKELLTQIRGVASDRSAALVRAVFEVYVE